MSRRALHLTALALLLALALPGAVWVVGHVGHHDHAHPVDGVPAACQELGAAWLHGHAHDAQVPDHQHAWSDPAPGAAREARQRAEASAPTSPLVWAWGQLDAQALGRALDPDPPDGAARSRPLPYTVRSTVLRL
jgi:hypothetical protein